jgi:tetraacyldisaccharide 4'-kinase
MIFKNKISHDLFRLIRTGLIPLIPFYYLLFMLNKKIKRTRDAGLTVVCVGNITTGGTGKTPAVIYIAGLLKGLGYSPAVVSRGYGGSKSGEGAVVSDGENIFLTPDESGDEPYLMAAALKGVPVAIGKNRLPLIEKLQHEFNVDIIVMDDGYQNFSIQKDISVAVIDAVRPFGNCLLLPAGDLREPKSSLGRSDIILLNKSDLAAEGNLRLLKKKISKTAPAAGIFNSRYKINSICRVNDIKYREKIESIKGKKVIALSGIGNPKAFTLMLEKFKPAILKPIVYPDHYRIAQSDIPAITKKAEWFDYVIMTEKDYVKFMKFDLNEKFFFLKIEMEISDNDEFKKYFI